MSQQPWRLAMSTVFWSFIFFLGVICMLLFLWPVVLKKIFNMGTLMGILAGLFFIGLAVWHRNVLLVCKSMWQGHKGIVAVFLLLCCIGFAWAGNAVISIVKAETAQIPPNTPAIVLGCSVIGKRPSRILKERLDAAKQYLEENPQAIAILSGGQGADEEISEAQCMYEYLSAHGISRERLYMEAESDNTQQNLRNSIQLLQELDVLTEVTIITSEFHLYRGRRWAGQTGITAYGYGARTHWSYLPTFFVREVLAVMYLKLRLWLGA